MNSDENRSGMDNGDGEVLNADDFVDRHPNRTECRQLLKEVSGDAEKIEAWNRMIKRTRSTESWKLDLSDKADPWEASNIVLSVEGNNNELVCVLLRKANLEEAILRKSNLKGADLREANLEGAKLNNVNLSGAKLFNANLSGANLHNTNLAGAMLGNAKFGKPIQVSWLAWRSFKAELGDREQVFKPSTVLDKADLRKSIGFISNGQSARGALFSAHAHDPYSVVRGAYTGPLMVFHLIFLAVFFVPYIIRAGIWTVLSKGQSVELAQSTLGQMDWVELESKSVLGLVLGFGPGFWGTLGGMLSVAFVVYNICRGAMTWWLSQVRDAEERSSHLPEFRQYWWCYWLHQWFMRWFFWIAIMAFVYHMVRWMESTVMVPTKFAG